VRGKFPRSTRPNGVDASFRSVLIESDYKDKSLCAVAYPYRLKKITDLPVKLVVPDTVHPRSAPRVRTLWMTEVADIAVVFPDDPVSNDWGKGSTVAINAMIKQGKPVFVATGKKPFNNSMVKVLPTSLFGVVKGYFIVPHTAKKPLVSQCHRGTKGVA
jgi:uncharacterized protein (DUF608 family)